MDCYVEEELTHDALQYLETNKDPVMKTDTPGWLAAQTLGNFLALPTEAEKKVLCESKEMKRYMKTVFQGTMSKPHSHPASDRQ